jgi:predicted Zn-dependent protease
MTLGAPASRVLTCLRRQCRPWRLLVAALLLAGGAIAAVEGYAWYHFDAAADALAQYQNDAARRHLDRCLAIWPRSPAAHLLAARAERRAGHFSEASEHLDQCQQHADQQHADEIAFEWALLHTAVGDLSMEETLQARIMSRPADAPLIWEALAAGYRRTCRLPEALNSLNAWLHFEPDNAYAYFLRGELHRSVGAVGRARDEYARAVELDPGHDQARRLLARMLVSLGRYQDAAEHLRILQGKLPDDPELEMLLARSEHDLGQREEAVARLDALLARHPDYGPGLRERGRLALAAKEFAAAQAFLERAQRALPNDYDVQSNLQRALQYQGHTAEAKAWLSRAQQLKDRLERIADIQMREMTAKPYDAKLHCELGELMIGIGQRESGSNWLQSALRLDPNLPAAHAALADYYKQEGDPLRAGQHGRAAASLASASAAKQ